MDEANARRLAALEFEMRQMRTAIVKAGSHAKQLTTDGEHGTLHRLWEARRMAAEAVAALSDLFTQLQQAEHDGMGPEHAGWCAGPSTHVIPDLSEMDESCQQFMPVTE